MAADFSENCRLGILLVLLLALDGADAFSPEGVPSEADSAVGREAGAVIPQALEAQAVVPRVVAAPASGCGGKCRRAVEYIGYTLLHLPCLDKWELAPKKEDAMLAILAARIARSSFETRSRLK